MRLIQCLLTRNDCYKLGRTMAPKGVMVHSTGANNPTLRRYVQPSADDPDRAALLESLGRNLYGNDWNRPGLSVCVHSFIGRLADGRVAAAQTLPWDRRAWHAGVGTSGWSANDGYLSFEICEDDLTDRTYFETVYREAVELTAYLCRQFGLDPLAAGVVISHAEGYRMGIASAHADVDHWFPRFGKSMDQFRADVAAELAGEEEDMTQERFDELMDDYLARRAAWPPGAWSAEARAWAEERGIVQGDDSGRRYRSFATREETVTMLYRYARS